MSEGRSEGSPAEPRAVSWNSVAVMSPLLPCCRCARWEGWSESAPWARTPRGRTGSWPATTPCECSPCTAPAAPLGHPPLLPYLLLFCLSQLMFYMLWQGHYFNCYNTSVFLLLYGFCLRRWLLAGDGWKCLWAHSWFYQLQELLFQEIFQFLSWYNIFSPWIFRKWHSLCIKMFPILSLLIL